MFGDVSWLHQYLKEELSKLCTFRSFYNFFLTLQNYYSQYTYNEQYCYKDKLLEVCLKEAPPLNKKTAIIGLTKL